MTYHEGMIPALLIACLLLLALALLGLLRLWLRLGRLPAEMEVLERRGRLESQAQLGFHLQPLQADLRRIEVAQAEGREGMHRAQSESLARGFASLEARIQEALRLGREEQGARLQEVQTQVQTALKEIQVSNEQRLDAMRRTVDQHLHEALEKRLGESFNLVAQRLEAVQKGLGEMQSLAQDVGGLKRALTNVKTRGVMGEAQLGALLEQFLAPGQYAAQVKVRPRAQEIVEFAVRLPGVEEGGSVWLPIDAKFPLEDYQRLMEAYEVGDAVALEQHGRALEARVLSQARDIRDKYIAPPHTTDFALLFLPFEGLYAEVLRRPGLLERVQRECRVTLVGPTTLTAFLNSLQVGFKTLAITRQSSEVWKILGGVKAEFGRFGEALAAVKKRLDDASTRLEDVSRRRDLMERRLARVETLPEVGPAELFPPEEGGAGR